MATDSRESYGTDRVADYYDSNTSRFLALGGGARSHSIHRALWGPGVTSFAAAANYINVLIGDAVASRTGGEGSTIFDFGCGVGGTLFSLARRFPKANLHGVTISTRQHALAERYGRQLGVAERCSFHCGDFESIDLGLKADVVVAVESMVHARSAANFLANAMRHLAPEGALIVVDDFIAAAGPLASETQQTLREFREGWRLSSLDTVPAFVAAAESTRFELAHIRDLSCLIRLNRPRDRVIAAISPFLRRFTRVPMFANLVGGAALTRGQRAGSLGYYWLQFTD